MGIIIFVCSIPVAMFGTWLFCYWHDKNQEMKDALSRVNAIPLKFTQFKAFYDTNPSAWVIAEGHYPLYRKWANGRKEYMIVFSPLDFRKYNKWVRIKKEKEREIAKYKLFADAMECWQKDAKDCEKRAQRELDKAREELKQIQERLTKNEN